MAGKTKRTSVAPSATRRFLRIVAHRLAHIIHYVTGGGIMTTDFEVLGTSAKALFSLKIHRGDGMALLAMNWLNGQPPLDFVGFGIEYKEPNGDRFYQLKNRICFPGADPKKDSTVKSTLRSPIQMFRWVHFPRNAELEGSFTYRVTPVFMNDLSELSYGEPQIADIELRRDTYPNQLNIAFTRGLVSSQAFVDRYEKGGAINTLLPTKAKGGLTFKAEHPDKEEAWKWMGFEARSAILDVLKRANADGTAEVRVIAYDLNVPEIVEALWTLGSRLKIIIDNSPDHGEKGSAENQAEVRLNESAGPANVKRQHMEKLQHNKVIIVSGDVEKIVVCGSTNFSWRALYVQNNNAIVMQGANVVNLFMKAFDNYWAYDSAADFGATASALMTPLGLPGIDASVAFSPHLESNARLKLIADDIQQNSTSSVFYALAFLAQTGGPVLEAIKAVTKKEGLFVYGMADKPLKGVVFQKPNGKPSPVSPAALTKGVPEPFKSEPSGGAGIRMHHKFVVIDFDKPSARVYVGSYNFSDPADVSNGENLLLIRDRRIAVSYMVEALTIFDHYHFRINQFKSKSKKKITLAVRPKKKEKPWWEKYYTDKTKIRDREMFA
jgi:phosphatidylserine/phosphatidylglycerophosphate/cardiolipin synthase-like enzyme